jgi:thioredoxin-related protein
MIEWPRRKVLMAMGAAAVSAPVGNAIAARRPIAGMEPEPWFAETTGDLRKDLKAASDTNKVLALIWEQHGCEYCHQMHDVALKQPELIALGKKRFHVLQMDLWGDREFIDFDGEKLSEAKIARGLAVRGTPSTVFYDETGDLVFRMPGYASPEIFFLVYQYVDEEGYQSASLQEWAKLKYGAN